METSITSRNFELNDSLREYIHNRLDKLGRAYSRIYRFEVILEEEKIRKNVEIIVHLKRNRIIAKESSPEIYASVDSAVGRIKKQLRRLNDRLRSKRRRTMLKRFMKPMTMFRERR